jgi:hypothetical protein
MTDLAAPFAADPAFLLKDRLPNDAVAPRPAPDGTAHDQGRMLDDDI